MSLIISNTGGIDALRVHNYHGEKGNNACVYRRIIPPPETHHCGFTLHLHGKIGHNRLDGLFIERSCQTSL